jgi:hypothetical protein
MSAKYLRPGAYRVACDGIILTVLAKNPCEALAIAARILGIGEPVQVAA